MRDPSFIGHHNYYVRDPSHSPRRPRRSHDYWELPDWVWSIVLGVLGLLLAFVLEGLGVDVWGTSDRLLDPEEGWLAEPLGLVVAVFVGALALMWASNRLSQRLENRAPSTSHRALLIGLRLIDVASGAALFVSGTILYAIGESA